MRCALMLSAYFDDYKLKKKKICTVCFLKLAELQTNIFDFHLKAINKERFCEDKSVEI